MAKVDLSRTDPRGKVPKRTVLLRQRFDNNEQMARHLHAVEGSTLFFFRAPTLVVPVGNPVLLELCLETSDQTRLMRGSVLARAEEQGLWLQFPGTRAARPETAGRSIVPRKGRRVATDHLVRLRRIRGEYLGMMLDVSQGGARVGGGLPPGLLKGHDVTVVLSSPERGDSVELGQAKVVWVRDGEAGLAFDRASAQARIAIAKFYQSVADTWNQAIEVTHLRDCCGSAGVREPPMPRLGTEKDSILDKLF